MDVEQAGKPHAGLIHWLELETLPALRRTPACRWRSSKRSRTCTTERATTARAVTCSTLTLTLLHTPQDPSLSLAFEYAEHDLYGMACHHHMAP